MVPNYTCQYKVRRDGICVKTGRDRGLPCSTELSLSSHVCFAFLRTLVFRVGYRSESTASSTAMCSGQECICHPSSANEFQAEHLVCAYGEESNPVVPHMVTRCPRVTEHPRMRSLLWLDLESVISRAFLYRDRARCQS